jgi:hypothetical protein
MRQRRRALTEGCISPLLPTRQQHRQQQAAAAVGAQNAPHRVTMGATLAHRHGVNAADPPRRRCRPDAAPGWSCCAKRQKTPVVVA